MTLNNDTRISKGFVAGLLDPRLPADTGIVGPMIDHGFRARKMTRNPRPRTTFPDRDIGR
ncbi:putative rhamnosyl transferase wbbL2 [Mycobacterium ulcerans str. Harvey]|uniref:Rhamnosyl transferase wbbL2 n=1 Tax=Mycobacterium ulcerans str. Harvey TaxID=1299332 RepID=A0ABP3A2Y8_MYCUL|nr:putative rhamnosyl transferase wbbL2 [Mycobacterium ulcerans str. Harvey]